jgi:FixJ family two-component response regulator
MDKRPMIAIVDDDESMREAIISLMRSAGYEPVAFPCAGDFLDAEQARRTDCLIADVQMPGMSGIELHGKLVQSGEAIPTVLITAHPDEKARVRAIKAGVVAYLAKPFNEDELLDCIQTALNMGDTRSEKS